MKKILISERSFLGTVARWATEQSPYHRPENLEVVLDALHKELEWFWVSGKLGFKEFVDRKEVVDFVRTNLRKIPEYLLWNERKNGNQAPLQFTSRYDKEGDPDNDFIDLDALERNVTNDLVA